MKDLNNIYYAVTDATFYVGDITTKEVLPFNPSSADDEGAEQHVRTIVKYWSDYGTCNVDWDTIPWIKLTDEPEKETLKMFNPIVNHSSDPVNVLGLGVCIPALIPKEAQYVVRNTEGEAYLLFVQDGTSSPAFIRLERVRNIVKRAEEFSSLDFYEQIYSGYSFFYWDNFEALSTAEQSLTHKEYEEELRTIQVASKVKKLRSSINSPIKFRGSPIAHVSIIPHHLLNWKDMEAGMVNYIATPRDMERERWTTMKLGKYLRRYYDTLTDAEIQAAVGHLTGSDLKLELLTDEDEIREAYADISDSCMGGRWADNEYHPSVVYSHTPDVAVAYIKGIGRSVLNMKDKTFYSVYGDRTRLLPKLVAAGFNSGSSGLQGCRIRKVYERGSIVMPYLDGEQSVYEYDDDFFMVGTGTGLTYLGDASATNGRLYEEEHYCECCGDYFNSVQDTFDGEVCEDCIAEHYVTANVRGDEALCHFDNCIECNGEYYHTDYLDFNGIVYCVDTCEYKEESEAYNTEDGEWVMYLDSCTAVFDIDQNETVWYYGSLPRHVVEYDYEDCSYIQGADVDEFIAEQEEAA